MGIVDLADGADGTQGIENTQVKTEGITSDDSGTHNVNPHYVEGTPVLIEHILKAIIEMVMETHQQIALLMMAVVTRELTLMVQFQII